MKRVVTEMVDDLDGGRAVTTTRFALDGTQYEIDLSGANDETLRGVLAPYIAAGSKVAKTTPSARSTTAERPEIDLVAKAERIAARDWALAQGLTTSTRGRIAEGLLVRYRASVTAQSEPVSLTKKISGGGKVVSQGTGRKRRTPEPAFSG